MLRTAEFWVAVSFVGFLAILVYYKVPALDRQGARRSRGGDPQGAGRGAAPARGGAKPPQRLPEKASQRRPGSRGDHRAGAPRRGGLREGNSRRSRRDARKADQTGRGEDRPRGGPGGRRRPRSGRRHRVGRGGKDTARESRGCSRCGPRRRGHSQSQRPAELSGAATPCHSHHPRPELRRRTGCAHQAVVRHSSPRAGASRRNTLFPP